MNEEMGQLLLYSAADISIFIQVLCTIRFELTVQVHRALVAD